MEKDKQKPIPVVITKPELTPEEKAKQKFWKDFKKDFMAGSLSGAAVTLTTQPLDTIAVDAQANTDFGKKIKLRDLRPDAKTMKTLYRGTGPRLIKSTAAGAIGYPVFMAAANKIEKEQKKTAALIPIKTDPNASKILPKLYHSADPAEFGRSRRMPTSDAIEYLTKS